MKVFCSLSASVASISGINYCFKCSLIGKSEIVIGDKRCTIEEAACPLNSWIVKKKCLFFFWRATGTVPSVLPSCSLCWMTWATLIPCISSPWMRILISSFFQLTKVQKVQIWRSVLLSWMNITPMLSTGTVPLLPDTLSKNIVLNLLSWWNMSKFIQPNNCKELAAYYKLCLVKFKIWRTWMMPQKMSSASWYQKKKKTQTK